MVVKALAQLLLLSQVVAGGASGASSPADVAGTLATPYLPPGQTGTLQSPTCINGTSSIKTSAGSVVSSPKASGSVTPSVKPSGSKSGSSGPGTPSVKPSSIISSKASSSNVSSSASLSLSQSPSGKPSSPVVGGSTSKLASGGSSKPVGSTPAASSSASRSVLGSPSSSKGASASGSAGGNGPSASSSASGSKVSGTSSAGSQPTGSSGSGSQQNPTVSVTHTNGSGSSPTGYPGGGGQPSNSGLNGNGGSGAPGSMAAGSTTLSGPIGGSSPSGVVSQSGGGSGTGGCPVGCQSSCPTKALEPTATLGCGVVRGTTTSLPAALATVNKFLGVPFAQSPPRRFSPPQEGASCDVDATAFKPACIQQFIYPEVRQDFTKLIFNNPGGPPPAESEDCLYLNVYAPSSPPPPGGRAVMFWIYGGALQFGTAGQPGYDGSYFAAYEDVIVVTTNYRTNVFGFATSPEIPVSERNLGFLDQRAALDWVQQNIAAFGGDKSKVTIFGESAGAFSVDTLLTSFPANSTPPFRGAILQSGQFSYNANKMPSTVPQWNQLAQILNCPGNYSSNLACLRAANASAIKNAIEVNVLEFNPVADGITLVSNPMQQRLSGNIAKIPVLEGSNAQEGRVFAVGQSNTTAYLQSLGLNDTAVIQALEAAYPLNSTGIGSTDYDQSSQIFTELVFQCPSAYHANATVSVGIPAWRYYFNASFPNFQPFPGLGVYHSSEIPFVFSTYPRTNVTVQEYALSQTMRRIWASFAKNPAAGPGWNAVGTGMEASVLVGASGLGEGGIFIGKNGTLARGGYDLGVLGNRGNVLGSGVTIIDQSEVDYRCGLYAPLYQANANIGS